MSPPSSREKARVIAAARRALVEAVKRVERGELGPSPDVIRDLLPA